VIDLDRSGGTITLDSDRSRSQSAQRDMGDDVFIDEQNQPEVHIEEGPEVEISNLPMRPEDFSSLTNIVDSALQDVYVPEHIETAGCDAEQMPLDDTFMSLDI
jgi:hypothetical protein